MWSPEQCQQRTTVAGKGNKAWISMRGGGGVCRVKEAPTAPQCFCTTEGQATVYTREHRWPMTADRCPGGPTKNSLSESRQEERAGKYPTRDPRVVAVTSAQGNGDANTGPSWETVAQPPSEVASAMPGGASGKRSKNFWA